MLAEGTLEHLHFEKSDRVSAGGSTAKLVYFVSNIKLPATTMTRVSSEVAGELKLGDATVQLNRAWGLFL